MSDNTKRGIIFSVILLAILFALGLRIDHPKSGLKNALGPAPSSIAVYWHKSELSPGDRVIARIEQPELSPILAIVNNVSPDFIDIQTNEGFQRIPAENVKGSLVMVFPFIGTLLGLVGL